MAGRTAGGTAPDTKNSSQARRKALARSCESVVSAGIETVGDTPTHYPGADVSAVDFDVLANGLTASQIETARTEGREPTLGALVFG